MGGVMAHHGLATSPRCCTSGLSQGHQWVHDMGMGRVQEMGTENNYFLSWSVDEWGSDRLAGELAAALCLVRSPGPGTGKTLERSQ